ncbi:preprotein translocase subunit SecG [Spirochaetota bacterium]
MNVLLSVATVVFVILCVLLVILILLQSDKSAGMGILGGSSQSTFGSSTADVITKISAVMVGIFMLGSLGLAILESNRVTDLDKKLSKGKTKTGMIEKGNKTKKDKDNLLFPMDNKGKKKKPKKK